MQENAGSPGPPSRTVRQGYTEEEKGEEDRIPDQGNSTGKGQEAWNNLTGIDFLRCYL